MDTQTDGRIAISISRVSVLTRDKKLQQQASAETIEVTRIHVQQNDIKKQKTEKQKLQRHRHIDI